MLAALPGICILCLYYKEKRFSYKFWVPESYRTDEMWYWILAFYSNASAIYASFLVAPLDIIPVLFISTGTGLLEELCQQISNILTVTAIIELIPVSGPSTFKRKVTDNYSNRNN